jgi:hypothetical protein
VENPSFDIIATKSDLIASTQSSIWSIQTKLKNMQIDVDRSSLRQAEVVGPAWTIRRQFL